MVRPLNGGPIQIKTTSCWDRCAALRPFPKGLSYNSPAKWQVRPAKWQGWIPDSKQPVVRRAGWQGGPAVLQGLLYSSTCKMVVKRLIPVDKKYHAHLTSNSNITFALDVIKNKLSKDMGFKLYRHRHTCTVKYHGVMCPRMLGWSCPSTSNTPNWLSLQSNDALVVAVWDPYTSVDDEQRAALTAFLDDQSTQFHVVEYDMMDKSSFNLILTSGGWLRDQEIDAAMYYIRKRITNNPQLFDQRCIVTDCMFWASMHGRYVKYLKNSPNEEEDELTKDADWEKEMRDSPFDMYALGMLPVGSKSWLEIDYVYVPVNNDKNTVSARMAWRTGHHAGPYLLIFTFKIGEEGPAGWPVLHAIRRPSSSNLHIGTCRMAWRTGHHAGPYLLIQTFKIGDEGLAGWTVLHAILQGLPHPIFI
ncbi:hypothetical protein FNV43_RR21100 [Rhamnella rubrinervis]|uniref:Uncharacterized protein n=1 Tax=Rhamnella rubrinervis TaxID=2594499 RepID=A0A8K0E030_9ROSA|nr:hypothetical protein FNV43_RR21100 [Rhamnella rubrinervis]